MTILAKNKATKLSGAENTKMLLLSVLLIVFGIITVCALSILTQDTLWLLLILLPPAFVILYIGFSLLDCYLKWNYAEETISVQYETLIIECRRSLFRHRKEIPLSTIDCVVICDDTIGISRGLNTLYETNVPETLKVVYSGSHRYRFGICMTDEKRDFLAKAIMALTDEYK